MRVCASRPKPVLMPYAGCVARGEAGRRGVRIANRPQRRRVDVHLHRARVDAPQLTQGERTRAELQIEVCHHRHDPSRPNHAPAGVEADPVAELLDRAATFQITKSAAWPAASVPRSRVTPVRAPHGA